MFESFSSCAGDDKLSNMPPQDIHSVIKKHLSILFSVNHFSFLQHIIPKTFIKECLVVTELVIKLVNSNC